MKSNVKELISLLVVKGLTMEELVQSHAEEQRCIVALDLAALQENSKKKAETMATLTELQRECRRLMREAGSELGLGEVPTLSTLVSAADETVQVELRPLQRRLAWLATTLEKQQEMNRGMLENSLSRVRCSMALFGQLLGGRDTYGAQGRLNSGALSGRVLHREI